MPAPLKNVRVLDLTRILAGPWAGQCLADLGAEVIKIERPKGGDDTRAWGPPFFGEGDEAISAYFMSANRGKHSVAVDMATPEGQDTIRALAAKCDIVIENFKVDGLKKYGLDYESLKAVNPGLIYCSVTGFGQTGPYRHKPGYDLVVQAMGGLMSVTGNPDDVPGGGPIKAGVAVTDLFTGLYGVIGILAALRYRDETGIGQHIDMSLLDTKVAVLANLTTSYLVSGDVPQRYGNGHPTIVPYDSFATSDGHVILAVGNDSQFRSFCEAAGMPALADDPRFETNPKRVENRAEIVPIVAGLIKGRSTDEWVAILEEAGVPGGPINTMDRVFNDEQIKARGMEISIEDSLGRNMPGVRNPIRFSETPMEFKKAPPRLGEDTEEVLANLLGDTLQKTGS